VYKINEMVCFVKNGDFSSFLGRWRRNRNSLYYWVDTTIYVMGLMAHPTAASTHVREARHVQGEISGGAAAQPTKARGQAGQNANAKQWKNSTRRRARHPDLKL
jgi:hypothetical protein